MNAPVSSLASASPEELRASLLELINVCPLEHCNPPDCPLFALRNMRPRERVAWLNALAQADLEYLAAYHYACMNVRLGNPRAAA